MSNKGKPLRNPVAGPLAGKGSAKKEAFSLAWNGYENADVFRTESQNYGNKKGEGQRASSQKRVLADYNRDAIDNLADQMADLQIQQKQYYGQQPPVGQDPIFGKRVVKRGFDPWNEAPGAPQQQQQQQPSTLLYQQPEYQAAPVPKSSGQNKNQSTFTFGDYNYFLDPESTKKSNLPNKNIKKNVVRDEQYLQNQLQDYDYGAAEALQQKQPPAPAYPPNGYRVNQPPGGKSKITLG